MSTAQSKQTIQHVPAMSETVADSRQMHAVVLIKKDLPAMRLIT